eukprot:gene528-1181_t
MSKMTKLKASENEAVSIADINSCKEYGWVRLRPYENQVSGHHRVMLYDNETICKPVMAKEYNFYKSTPTELERFIPKYKGIANSFAETDNEGNIILYAAKILPENHQCCSNQHELPETCSSYAERSCSHGHISKPIEKCHWRTISLNDASGVEGVHEANPWVTRVQKLSFEQNIGSEFILLENIGRRFKRPCILDLKMGTRQHGDDVTDKKIKDHIERCEQSTSKALGTRLCGMQVYHPDTSCYSYLDKYTGRDMDPVGFENSLFMFLLDGQRTDVIEPFIRTLKDLYRTIERLDTYRFFCISLLLMYEGDVSVESKDSSVEVRMIDFSHITLKGENSSHEGPDVGYLFGLRNLVRLLDKFRKVQRNNSP